MEKVKNTILKNYPEETYRRTCGLAVEDIIDFFIDHDDEIFCNFKNNIHLIDLTRNLDVTLSKEEISDYFVQLKKTLKQDGYKLKSGPFIEGKNLKPNCCVGVHVLKENDSNATYLTFGVDSSEKFVIDTIIRYKDV